jgi:hypothetical protein
VAAQQSVQANGHFFVGALAGCMNKVKLPILCYILMNGHSYAANRTLWHTQDDLMSFGKGALLGFCVINLETLSKYIHNTLYAKQLKITQAERTLVKQNQEIMAATTATKRSD